MDTSRPSIYFNKNLLKSYSAQSVSSVLRYKYDKTTPASTQLKYADKVLRLLFVGSITHYHCLSDNP